TGLLSVVVEDFSGNRSEPTVIQLENGVPVNPKDLIGEEQIPDAALRSAIRSQIGVTLTALEEYEGKLNLAGTAVRDLTGLELIPGLTAIDFSGCTNLEEISGLEANGNLNEINISRCSALKVLDVAGLGLEKLVGDGSFNDLVAVDISDNRLDLSAGTPERAFLDTAIDVIVNGNVTEPEPEIGEFQLGENLLPGGTIVTSSNTADAIYFVDGDTASSTYATDRNQEAAVVIDLGESKALGGFAIWTSMNSDDPARPYGVKSGRLEIADTADGPYTEVCDATITATTTQGELISAQVKLEQAVTARYVRVTVTAWWPHPNGGNDWPAMYEAQVFEAIAASAMAIRPMSAEAGVRFGGQRPVPYAAVAYITEPIVREVSAETLDMTPYAELSATIRGTDYTKLGEEQINGISFLASDVDLNAKPAEALTISIADQNRQGIEGAVIDLSFDATWTVLYKNAAGETVGTITVIVGDGGKITTPELMTGDVTILYATTASGQVASEMPIYAFDGNDGTKWCPGGNAIQAELSIDVGGWFSLTEVKLIHAGHLESGRNTVDFDFQVLKDVAPTAEQLSDTAYLTNDDNWVTVASYRSNNANETVITFDEPVVGRYFRLDVLKGDNSANWPSTRIYEWSMMGIPTDAPGELPHEHAFGEWTVTKEATCTEEGSKERVCECGEKETEVIAALGHSAAEAVKENEKAPTCTEAGSYDSVVYCTECDAEISRETVTVDALGHDFVN
ncbi:MAG: discoidin domain-containing protein, partial [Oscillospiraceae bacterium]|nr:discoidin domain-containing protein [Oscillospiraceae bacterium]